MALFERSKVRRELNDLSDRVDALPRGLAASGQVFAATAQAYTTDWVDFIVVTQAVSAGVLQVIAAVQYQLNTSTANVGLEARVVVDGVQWDHKIAFLEQTWETHEMVFMVTGNIGAGTKTWKVQIRKDDAINDAQALAGSRLFWNLFVQG